MRRLKVSKVKVGDTVLVNNNAFDEQLEAMEDTTKIFTVTEILKTGEGTSGQWAKVKPAIRLVSHNDGEVRTDDGWIDSAWLKKYGDKF